MQKVDLDAVLKQFTAADILSKTFTGVRIVDPVSKQVLAASYEGREDHNCYEFFDRKEPCINCISSSACSTGMSHKKIEWREHQAFFMTACSIGMLQELQDTAAFEWVVSVEQKRPPDVHDGYIEFLADDLNTMAVMDMMTGVYNRNFIMQRLPYMVESHRREQRSMALMMVDVDSFKSINDIYGHLAGDDILRQMASILKRHVRKEQDFVARYGGEEFVVFLANSDIEIATQIAERMRREIEATYFDFKHHRIRMTSSFGMVSMQPNEGINANFLMEVADKALYSAKSEGKNRVKIGYC